MSEQSWTEAGALLLEAIELDETERPGFLTRLGEKDEALKREVEKLLEAHLAAGDFLTARLDTGSPILDAGDEVGHYRILRLLGRGGMGSVYLAERTDGVHEEHVALKLANDPPGRDGGAQFARRFAEERRILARLVHRHIARFLDGGTSADGRPYLVMEYIDGKDIRRFCQQRRLDLNDRIRMFCKLCNAVHFAHRNLVIHGDLKPSNVLVDTSDEPRLLDFGIAKWLARKRFDEPSGPRPLSPRYASPEQRLGAPITTATDIYSLGVIIFELLTDLHPNDARASFEKPHVGEAIRETSAVPLASSAVETMQPKLAQSLRGDLDAILNKAMRARPEERFASANELRLDLERYLDHRPISARSVSFFDQARLFVARNRRAVAASAVGFLVALAFLIQFAVQHQEVLVARERADQVAAFLIQLFEVSDPENSRGETITARELLDRGAKRIRHDLETTPATRAELLTTIGEVYTALGLFDPAIELLDEAIELRLEHDGNRHPRTARSKQVLALARYGLGDYERARILLNEALIVIRDRLGGTSLEAATVERDLADVLYDLGQLEDAEASYRQAHATFIEHLGPHNPEAIKSADGIASVLAARGRLAEAEQLRRTHLETLRQHLGPLVDHPDLALALNNLGYVYWQQDKLEEARTLFVEALDIQRRLVGEEHPLTTTFMANLANVETDRGEFDRAESLLRRVLELDRRLLGKEHPSIAASLLLLAGVLERQGNLDAAESRYRESLNLRVRVLGMDHASTGYSALRLGTLLSRVGRPGEAEPFLRQAVTSMRAWAPGSWQVSWAELALGKCLIDLSQYEEAVPLLLDSYRGSLEQRGPDHPQTLQARESLLALPVEFRPAERIASGPEPQG